MGRPKKDEFLSKLLDSLPLAVFCKSYEKLPGVFVYWNSGCSEIFGLSQASVLGKSDFDFFPKDEAEFFQQKDLEAIDSGKQVYVESEEVTSSKTHKRIVRTWKVPLIHEDVKYMIGISQDITEQKALEEKLQEEKTRRIQDAKLVALGEMAGGIAHEINNPLAIIGGYLANLQKMSKKGILTSERLDEVVEKTNKTILRMTKTVSSMRSLARTENQLVSEDESFLEIVSDVANISAEKMQGHGVTLTIENVVQQEDVKIKCMRISLSQVLLNLINNSYDSLIDSNLQEKWIHIKAKELGDRAIISVTDAGNGINSEFQEKIFDPFFTTKKIGKGTGIGLSLSRSLIEKQNGTLYYDKSSNYTRFVIDLPLGGKKQDL